MEVLQEEGDDEWSTSEYTGAGRWKNFKEEAGVEVLRGQENVEPEVLTKRVRRWDGWTE